MKIISRPETTSLVVEFRFHLINSEIEWKNVLESESDGCEPVEVGKGFHPLNYQPILLVVLKRPDQMLFHGFKYAVPVEYMVSTKEGINHVVAS